MHALISSPGELPEAFGFALAPIQIPALFSDIHLLQLILSARQVGSVNPRPMRSLTTAILVLEARRFVAWEANK
jgi:hypothetical protein